MATRTSSRARRGTNQNGQLTKKQQQVFDALAAGQHPNDIAKSMGVSGSNVYGHMRRIRAAGFTLPTETAAAAREPAPKAPPAPPVATTNGHADEPEVALREAIVLTTDRIAAIDAENEQLDTRRGELDQEHKSLLARQQKYQAALEALA